MPVRFESASFTGQAVLVTAGASGIGRTIAERFLSHGCAVHVCDINAEVLEQFLDETPGASGSVADVSDPETVDALFDDLGREVGRLDILVNNAGIAGPVGPLEDMDPAEWDRTLAVNLSGQFYVARRAIPIMKQARSGAIVNMASSAALFGCPNRAPYTASKWAVIGLTKTLAMELGPWGIRVNAVCPGSVEGGRIEQVIAEDARRRGRSTEEIRDIYQKQTSLRRLVTADEVANMVVFLASDLCDAISGQAMSVDGHTETLSHIME